MKRINLQNMHLEELPDNLLIETDGGGSPGGFRAFFWTTLIGGIIEHWDEIKREFHRGFHFADK